MTEKTRSTTNIVTVLWGENFIDRYLKTTLPTLLAPGNIPTFTAGRQCEYRIYTTAKDAEILSSAPTILALKKYLPVTFIDADYGSISNKYTKASEYFRLAIRDSFEAGRDMVLFTPDALWSDGTLSRIGELADQGYHAIMVCGPRVVGPPFLVELEALEPIDSQGALSVSASSLLDLVFKHMHPYEIATTWGAPILHDVPFFMNWPVPGEGLITRGFCQFPIYFRPSAADIEFGGAIDQALVYRGTEDAENIYYVQDANEMLAVSIDELGFSSTSFKSADTNERLIRSAKWISEGTNQQNIDAAHYPYFQAPGVKTPSKWSRAERRSRDHLEIMLSLAQLVSLHRELTEQGLLEGPKLLAYALYRGGLASRPGRNTRRTFFVPSDDAIMAIPVSNVSRHMAPNSSSDFLNILGAHVVPGLINLQEAKSRLGDCGIADGPHPVGDGLYYVVDTVLGGRPPTVAWI